LSNSLLNWVDNFIGKKIMVIGDMIADVYLEGKISRISREAPVLVLEYANETVVPGGAANVVYNVAMLGGAVYGLGVVGSDASGEEITRILQAQSVNTDGFYRDATRPTITKTRVIAGGLATVRQHVVRIDKETREPLSQEAEHYLLNKIEALHRTMDAVVLDDYGSNSITPKIREKTIACCRAAGVPCIVDSRYNILAYHGVTLVKQNEAELATAVGYSLDNETTLIRAGQELLQRLDADAVLITRGPDGITLFEKEGRYSHIPVTNASEVFDVSGAGDTVVATMMLALAAGAPTIDAVRLANFAAGIVVRKAGTATASPEELKRAIGGADENS